jgi:hypothetical protein
VTGQSIVQTPPPSLSMGNYSQTVGVTPVQIFPAFPRGGVAYARLWNVSPPGGPTIWFSRFTQTPALNAPGCYPLAPGEFEEFRYPAAIPGNAVWAVASGAGAVCTAEAGA